MEEEVIIFELESAEPHIMSAVLFCGPLCSATVHLIVWIVSVDFDV